MPGKHLFEYALVRIVPRVEREEFLNAGAILYSRSARFLQCRIHLPQERLQALCPATDCEEVALHLQSFDRICRGGPPGAPIGLLDDAARFRWLTAVRSAVVQTSRVHPGFCDDPVRELEKLMEQLVY